MKIGVFGAGAYGSALGKVAQENGHAIYFYDSIKFPERKMEDVLEFADAVILAVPAEAIEELLSQFPVSAWEKPLVVASKGLMTLNPYKNFRKVEIVSGPGFARDILRGKGFRLTVAGREVRKERTTAEIMFGGEQVKFDRTEDMLGVVLLGGLKNIYAIEAGRRGIGTRREEFKEYIEMVLGEARRFLMANGGFLETVELAAGVGDFVITCGGVSWGGARSRNYQFGELMKTVNFPAKTGVATRIKRGANFRKQMREIGLVEGVFAAQEIENRGLFVPKEAEILRDILRRINYATKR